MDVGVLPGAQAVPRWARATAHSGSSPCARSIVIRSPSADPCSFSDSCDQRYALELGSFFSGAVLRATAGPGLDRRVRPGAAPLRRRRLRQRPEHRHAGLGDRLLGSDVDWLRPIKATYDPRNVFQYDQSVPPAFC
ncbi:BBE domain-containing protein [Streptomyces misionensis]|uniref:BBE domain-containing protein n=1 Tax=Streptomyces misionensis TaxID=67331 RepID=UPI0037DA5F09